MDSNTIVGSRRAFLAATGAILLPGCTGSQPDNTAPSQRDSTTATAATDTSTATSRDTSSATNSTDTTGPEEELLDETHSVDDLDDVVGRLGYGYTTLDLRPADENADYANSVVFDDYNGELTVELDLNQALNQRHYNHPITQESFIQEFWQNAHDPEWRQRIHDEYIEAADGENILQLQEEIDWNRYQNGDDLDQRIEVSGVQDLWYKFAIANPEIDGISSVHNGIKAAAYQSLDQRHGHSSFYWDHDSQASNGDHGLIAATENPTRDSDEADRQENYTVETNYQVEQQIARVAESNFFQGDDTGINGYVEHPAEHDYNDAGKEKYMYIKTATEKWESELDRKIGSIPSSLYHQFTDDWFRNPTSEPAFDYFDRMNAAAYIAEENDGRVHHGESEIRFSAE